MDSLSPLGVRSYLPGVPLPSTVDSPTTAYPMNVHLGHNNTYFVPEQSFKVMGVLQSPVVMVLPYMVAHENALGG